MDLVLYWPADRVSPSKATARQRSWPARPQHKCSERRCQWRRRAVGTDLDSAFDTRGDSTLASSVMPLGRERSPILSALAFLLALPSGCATTADIYLSHERVVCGYVTDADSEQVYVRREMNDGVMTFLSPNEMAIPRIQIADIDHPGNGTLIIGVITAALGAGIARANSKGCDAMTMEIPCQLSHVPLATGIIMSVWGGVVWLRSVTAALPKTVKTRSFRLD